MFRLGMILMAICLVASLVLSATYKLTSAKIEQQSSAQEKEALAEVLAGADEFVNKKSDKFDYYCGLKDKTLIGYVLKSRARGYGGNIDMLVGIDLQGKIKGIEILSHEETPGLGSKISEPWFVRQFVDKFATELKMSEIQTISGATISSKAVLEAIKEDVKEFMAGI